MSYDPNYWGDMCDLSAEQPPPSMFDSFRELMVRMAPVAVLGAGSWAVLIIAIKVLL